MASAKEKPPAKPTRKYIRSGDYEGIHKRREERKAAPEASVPSMKKVHVAAPIVVKPIPEPVRIWKLEDTAIDDYERDLNTTNFDYIEPEPRKAEDVPPPRPEPPPPEPEPAAPEPEFTYDDIPEELRFSDEQIDDIIKMFKIGTVAISDLLLYPFGREVDVSKPEVVDMPEWQLSLIRKPIKVAIQNILVSVMKYHNFWTGITIIILYDALIHGKPMDEEFKESEE